MVKCKMNRSQNTSDPEGSLAHASGPALPCLDSSVELLKVLANIDNQEHGKTLLTRREFLVELMRVQDLDAIALYAEGGKRASPYHTWLAGVRCTTDDGLMLYLTREGQMSFIDVPWSKEPLEQRLNDLGLKDSIIHLADSSEEIIDKFRNLSQKWQRIGHIGRFPLELCSAPFERYITLPQIDLKMRKKSTSEIKLMRAAARELTEILDRVHQKLKLGISEADISRLIEESITASCGTLGIDPPRIVTGKQLNTTTGRPDPAKKLEQDSIICIDISHIVAGYYTDITRTFFMGATPAKEDYENLKVAHYKAIQQMLPGTTIRAFLDIVKDELRAVNLPADSLTSKELGHGIGYSMHQRPYVAMEPDLDEVFLEGEIIAMEPEIFGDSSALRIEDMVLITKGGGAILSSLSDFQSTTAICLDS